MLDQLAAPKTASTEPRRGIAFSLARLVAAFVVVLHFWLVWSIGNQPLDVNSKPGAAKSPIWPLHNDTIHRFGPGADFFAVYHAGRAIRAGLDPYANNELRPATPYWFPFRYLPIVGQSLGRLLSLFAPRTAYLIWLAVIEASLWVLVLLFWRRIAVSWLRALSASVLLLSSPYFLELHMGQFTFVAVAAVAVALMLIDSGHRAPRLAGGLTFAAAVALKVFPIACAPALIRHRRFFPALGLSVALLLTSLPYFAAHSNQAQVFLKTNFSQGAGMGSGTFGFVCVLHLLTRALDPGWQEHWATIAVAWRLLVLVGTAIVVFLARDRDPALGAAAMLLAHFVSYSDVWEHNASGIVAAGLLLLWAIQRTQPIRGATKLVLYCTAAALIVIALPSPSVFFDVAKNPHVSDLSETWSLAVRFTVAASKAIPTAFLFAVAVGRLVRSGFEFPWLPAEGRECFAERVRFCFLQYRCSRKRHETR